MISVPAAISSLSAVNVVAIVPPLASEIAAWTKAVVAICVEFVPLSAVGAVGVPVSAGLVSGARFFMAVPTAVAKADILPSSFVKICVAIYFPALPSKIFGRGEQKPQKSPCPPCLRPVVDREEPKN